MTREELYSLEQLRPACWLSGGQDRRRHVGQEHLEAQVAQSVTYTLGSLVDGGDVARDKLHSCQQLGPACAVWQTNYHSTQLGTSEIRK